MIENVYDKKTMVSGVKTCNHLFYKTDFGNAICLKCDHTWLFIKEFLMDKNTNKTSLDEYDLLPQEMAEIVVKNGLFLVEREVQSIMIKNFNISNKELIEILKIKLMNHNVKKRIKK